MAEVVRKSIQHMLPRGGHMQRTASNGVILDFSYAAQTEAEREQVLREIEEAAWGIVDELMERGEAV
jgi:hypothetical protein